MLAYTQAGDIWTKRINGDKAVRITTDGVNSAPRLSASLKWVAYLKGKGQIWMAQPDGASSRLIHDGGEVRCLKWSPVLDILAFVVKGELWAMTPQSGRPLLLASPSPPCDGCGVDEILWSPDGEWIAFQYDKRRETQGEEDWPWENSIMKVNARGGDPLMVMQFPVPVYSEEDDEHRPGNSMLACWTGPYILFWQCEFMSVSIMNDGCPLYILRPNGGQLTLPVTLLYTDFLAPSPDKRFLAITEGSMREAWVNKSISIADLQTGESKSLTEPDRSSFSPSWSPDGQRLAYVSGPAADAFSGPLDENQDVTRSLANRRIWTMRKNGSGKRPLTPDEGFRDERPVWLPDGEHILFARIDSSDQFSGPYKASLWLAGVNGGSPQLIAEGLSLHADSLGFPDYYGHIGWDKFFDYSEGPDSALLMD